MTSLRPPDCEMPIKFRRKALFQIGIYKKSDSHKSFKYLLLIKQQGRSQIQNLGWEDANN